jgi:hypothetical protein
MLDDILAALDLVSGSASKVSFIGDERLPSCFPVTDLASASIGAASLAISALIGLSGPPPSVRIDHRLASLWFGFSIRPLDWAVPTPWDAIAGDYHTRDGWIKLHTNAPHHKVSALRVLDCEATRDAVAKAVAAWDGGDLERAVLAAGGCAARLRGRAEWRSHAQGMAVSGEPLVHCTSEASPRSTNWSPMPDRPLAGLRVLDLTRVLAGPVATRFLAGYGASVLRLDPPAWDEPGVIPEVTLGKRCARLDLREPEGRRQFKRLLGDADILVHGYRADALEKLGLGPAVRQATRPGLIDVSLVAYGHTGPWTNRRGFDSLVQFSCGISAEGMLWKGSDAPISLPVQALDHATGYLMAAAAVRGVIARQRGEGSMQFRLSLARTAELLMAHGSANAVTAFGPDQVADVADDIEMTAWSPARRLRAPTQISAVPMRWDLPARTLGSSLPAWPD